MLTNTDIRKLKSAGFIDYEIFGHPKSLNTHETSDLRSLAWKAVLASRAEWTKRVKGNGWTDEQIINAIMNWYAGTNRDPWAFLKAEYQDKEKLNAYPNPSKRRARREVASFSKMR